MRQLKRPEMPAILREKQEEWTRKFREGGKARPDSSKYAHKDVKSAVRAMSHNKCAYCERLIAESEGNVEHRLGVDPAERAFEWENLYWACKACNDAKSALKPEAVALAVDPCDERVEPTEHLEFEDELITSWGGSPQGIATIAVFDLPRTDLNYRRLKRLVDYRSRREALRKDQRAMDARWFAVQQRRLLEAFAAVDQPFSAMFVARLRRLDVGSAEPK